MVSTRVPAFWNSSYQPYSHLCHQSSKDLPLLPQCFLPNRSLTRESPLNTQNFGIVSLLASTLFVSDWVVCHRMHHVMIMLFTLCFDESRLLTFLRQTGYTFHRFDNVIPLFYLYPYVTSKVIFLRHSCVPDVHMSSNEVILNLNRSLPYSESRIQKRLFHLGASITEY